MSKSKNKLNGSVDALASALHGVISEAVEKGNESMMEEMVAMEGRLKADIDTIKSDLETTNQNMSKQFATQARYISAQIDKRLGRPDNG